MKLPRRIRNEPARRASQPVVLMKTRFLLLLALLAGATASQAQPLMIRCETNKTVECGSAWVFDPPLGYINACPPTGLATITVLDTVTNGPCPLVMTRTWQVTDDCGNTATCSQSVTNTDTRAPEILCATNMTVECGTQWSFPQPTASDNCTATSNLIFSVVSTVTNFACPTVFTATRVWQVADWCGNTATCTQSVAVVDTTLPVLSCQCLSDPGLVQLTVTACSNAIPDLCAVIANCASDNCGPLTCTQSPPAGTIVLPGVHPITITVTDCASNSATCMVDFTVVAPPLQIVCPLPIGVPCGTPFALNPPPAQSLCCGTNVTVTALSTTTNGVCPQFVHRVWLATDCFGQTATCTQTVAIVDTTPPTFCVDSSVSNLVSNGSFEINTACPFNFSGQITFATGWSSPTLGSSDYYHPCATSPALGVPNNLAGNQAAFDGQAYAGIHGADTETSAITPLREYIQTQLTAPLVAGRTYNISFRVSLSDPATKAVDNLGAYLSTSAPSSFTWDPLPFIPQVRNPAGSFLTDKTGWTLIQGEFTADGGEEYLTIGNFYNNLLTPTNALAGTTNWAYYFIDDVRVVETCCRGLIVECPAGGIFEPPPALDDCSGTNVTVTLLTGSSTSPGCTQVHTLVWQAADPCGNTTTCTQRVTVVDTTAPVITCPGNITRNICSNSVKVHYKATATDACSLPVTVVCVPPSGTTFSLGTSTVTCTATDACGNSNSCSFTVTVVNSIFWQLLPAGVNDCYAQAGSEPAIPGACLTTAYPGGAWKHFDRTTLDRWVGHTWNFPLTWNILAAQLRTRARPPVNCTSGSNNDTISLGLSGCTSAGWQWNRFFGSGNASPGLVNAPWCNGSNCQYMFVFNLASLVPASGPPAISLLPLMNTTKRLDLFVQDDTTVDFANLRVQVCPPQIIGGLAVTLTNAELAVGPASWCLAPVNPELPFSADLRLGDPDGLRLPIAPLALAEHQGASIEFGASAGGGVFPVGYVFPRLSFSGGQGSGEVHLNGLPPGVPVVELEALVNGVVVQSNSVPASEGMLLATYDAAAPLGEFEMANRNELLATLIEQGSRVTLRVRLPGYTGGFPGARLAATGIAEIGVLEPELQMNRGVTGDGAKTVFAKFNDRASVGEISGGQAVASPLDPAGGETIGLAVSFAPTNEFRAVTPPPFGLFDPIPSNAVASSFVRGLIGGQEVDVDRLDFTRSGGDWVILWDSTRIQPTKRICLIYGPAGTQRIEVPGHSNLVVSVTELPTVLGKLGGATPCRRIIWPTLVPARVAGQVFEAIEIQLLVEVENYPVTALTGLRLEATGAESLVLSEVEFGPETFRLAPPELTPDGVIIRWNGFGGDLEHADTVRGPWSLVPGQFNGTRGEDGPKGGGIPQMYYRVKGR